MDKVSMSNENTPAKYILMGNDLLVIGDDLAVATPVRLVDGTWAWGEAVSLGDNVCGEIVDILRRIVLNPLLTEGAPPDIPSSNVPLEEAE